MSFADSDDTEEGYEGGNTLAPPGENRLKRRVSLRPGSGGMRNIRGRRPSIQQGPPAVQLLSIPQLDAIQRSLKLLDVRLQHVQNNVKEDEKLKDNVDHIRRVMVENQKALHSIVSVLASIQEEVRSVSICVHKNSTAPTTIQIQPAPKKKSGEKQILEMENSQV